MTRLSQDVMADIPGALHLLDRQLIESTGFNLRDLATRAAGGTPRETAQELARHKAAVIPITCGKGIIPGFAEAVRAVLTHLEMDAEIAGSSDVAGFGEAVRRGADILFAADDDRFLAINLRRENVTDNDRATALGFAQALSDAASKRGTGLAGKPVLVLGLGPVGIHGVEALHRLGARVGVLDPDEKRLSECVRNYAYVEAILDINRAFRSIDYIFDATPAENIITPAMVRPGTIISSPGVPHGLTRKALTAVGGRFIHDPLALGVAVMGASSVLPYPI